VQHEKYMVVAPAKWATAKPIYPAPTWAEREAGATVGAK
jgi:NADH:ubiquinone oxidoreductase subunit C